MAYEMPGADKIGSLVAAADLSAKQFFLAKIDAAGKVALCSAAGEVVAGVIENEPASGEAVELGLLTGVRMAKAGGAIAKGDLLKTDAAGKLAVAVKASTNTSDAGVAADALVGSFVIGIALEAAAADGNIISFLAAPMGAVTTTAS